MKVAVGCGWRYYGPDWTHIDGGTYPHLDGSDIYLKYHMSQVDLIYASHLIAYFDREEIQELLACWYKALKPGGILRIATPDFFKLKWLWETEGLNAILGPLYGRMKMADKMIYHKTTYDFKSLQAVLTNAGFSNVHLYQWQQTDHASVDDHSQAYYPHMDRENGLLLSLNVEATK